jgi:hypothetical protein
MFVEKKSTATTIHRLAKRGATSAAVYHSTTTASEDKAKLWWLERAVEDMPRPSHVILYINDDKFHCFTCNNV